MRPLQDKRLQLNTISSLIFQITTIICGFILPRLILSNFGSQVNGLINSITQYLHIIAFLELGVGAVVQSSLYKPLSERDDEQTSRIIKSAELFFTKIAIILLAYIVVLVVFYPLIVNKNFDYVYTATLIFVIGISSFAQYYFGVVDRLLLSADQRGYVQYIAQTITLILNTIACVILIKFGASVHVVKLITSIIYLVRPLFLRVYINRHYKINRKIKYAGEPIKQKWNGIAQHMAAVVLDQTDIIVLTSLSTLTNVSIYSVYHLIIYGIKTIFLSLTNGFQSLMGEMFAKKEMENLNHLFQWTEWLLHTWTVLIFGCTSVLVVPFVTVYTKNVMDVNYIVPSFALLIVLAHVGHCLRLPYNILILAVGHYKQTQRNYIVAAIMNIVISVFTVYTWGLIGVAIGTLCAMLYQTIWMAVYDSKHILKYSMKEFFKHITVDIIVFDVAYLITYRIPMGTVSYWSWIQLAIEDFMVWIAVATAVNYVVYREYVYRMVSGIGKMVDKMIKKICSI